MLVVCFIAQDGEFRKVSIDSRRIISVESPREERSFGTTKCWKAGESPMKKGGDVYSDPYHAYAIIFEFELSHKRARSGLESSLVLSSLNRVFYRCDLATNV